jgi:two-component system phosphate regulon sensor histidine kinase PhoR
MVDEDSRNGIAGRISTVMRDRLSQGRWTLLAAAVAIAVVYLSSERSILISALALAGVLGVAAFALRRSVRQRRAEEAKGDNKPLLDDLSVADLAGAIPDPLIFFDADGIVLYANQAAVAAFGGVTPGVSLRLKFRAPEMQELLRQALTEHAAKVIDYFERVPFEKLFQVTVTPVGPHNGVFALIFKDQSEARRIDRMRADFIANASHELRTPLASIAGFIETLRGPAKDDPPARENFLQIMQNQTSRMARLIDDLLSLSRLETKPYLRPGTKVDVRRIVEAVIDSLNPLASESGVEVAKELPDGPLEVSGNRDELFQVFENLLENACKYGASGGKVVVSIESGDDEVAVSFRDFGPGIAEEHIPRITERFYRVDVETSRAQKGTGLGLSIVKHILTRHNGRLSIKSEVGEGARFTVHLPKN